jgi:hypothetical protein
MVHPGTEIQVEAEGLDNLAYNLNVGWFQAAIITLVQVIELFRPVFRIPGPGGLV